MKIGPIRNQNLIFSPLTNRLAKIGEGQQKIKIVRTNRQSNLRGSCQSIFSFCRHHPTHQPIIKFTRFPPINFLPLYGTTLLTNLFLFPPTCTYQTIKMPSFHLGRKNTPVVQTVMMTVMSQTKDKTPKRANPTGLVPSSVIILEILECFHEEVCLSTGCLVLFFVTLILLPERITGWYLHRLPSLELQVSMAYSQVQALSDLSICLDFIDLLLD